MLVAPSSPTEPVELPEARFDELPPALPIDYDACAMPASLRARGWPKELSPTSPAEQPSFQPGAVTLVVLPDTQYYASCRSPHLAAQALWVAKVASARNVKAVLQLGDLTENNTDDEWQYVKDALAPIAARTPLLLATGNHDYGTRGTADRRTTEFQGFFSDPEPPTARVLAETQRPGDLENAYYRVPLDRGQATLGVLMLEWTPRTETVAWANSVLPRYPNDRVIVVTHAYLYHDSTRYDWWGKGAKQEWNPYAYGTAKRDPSKPATRYNVHPEGAYDGEMLWNELVSQHPNVFLTLNGHVLGGGTGLLTSRGKHGNEVHQVLVNYQALNEAGLGYLRLIEIQPDGATLRMKTYSPSLDRFANAEDQRFDLTVAPPLW